MANNSTAVRTEFLTGPAGSGKTFSIKSRIENDPGCAVLCATTGVAAVNMDTVTINSMLGYFDTDDLADKYYRGFIHLRLRDLAQPDRPRDITIDEVSMMHAEQLDTIYKAIHEVNFGDDQHAPLAHPLGLVLTGDFCQLPPVKGRWAFQADCWPEFAANVTRLTKIWRQTDPGFLDAVNAARRGDGSCAAAGLRRLGANYSLAVDMNFDGTTIVAKNAEADRFNQQRLLKIPEHAFALETTRWGVQSADWKHIPDRAIFKPTALVMLLANKKYDVDDISHDSSYKYVNGDLAHILYFDEHASLERWVKDENDHWSKEPYHAEAVRVESLRTGDEFWVERVTRQNTIRGGPDDLEMILETLKESAPIPDSEGEYSPYYDDETHKWIIGTIDYFPMRLGYCATVHKTQGLSLDRVQIDCRDGFFGAPSMAYVAISRARTVNGMRIVGGPDLLARRIKFNPEVKEWL